MKDDKRGGVPTLDEPPAALRAAAELVLDSPFPMALLWGAEARLLPNDACRVLGGLRPGASGRPAAEAWPELWSVVAEAVEAVRAGGGARRLEGRSLPGAVAGPAAVYALALTPARGEDGVAAGVVLTILERRQDERARERERAESDRSRAQLEAVLQVMQDGVVVFDRARTALFVNEAEARINGFASAREMQRDLALFAEVYELADAQGRALPVEQWPVSRVLRGETLHELELLGRRRDTGREWVFSFSGAAATAAGGGTSAAGWPPRTRPPASCAGTAPPRTSTTRSRPRRPCASRIGARTSSSPCSPTSCATRSRPSATASTCSSARRPAGSRRSARVR